MEIGLRLLFFSNECLRGSSLRPIGVAPRIAAWDCSGKPSATSSTLRARWQPRYNIVEIAYCRNIFCITRVLASLALVVDAQAGWEIQRAAPGIEPRTSRTRSENHATRPSSRL
eukprot:7762219-Prorocentrum_lima.AAC.1